MKKRILGIILVLIMLISIMPLNTISVSAGTDEWKNVSFWASKSIKVYKNTKTTTSSGTIDSGDKVTIDSYHESSDRFKVTYPITRGSNKGGTGTGYIKRSDVCKKYNSTSWTVADGFTVSAYQDKSCKKITTIESGAKVIVVDQKSTSNMMHVIATIKGKKYLVWVKKADVRKTPNISELKTYKIASKLNTNYVLDVAGGSKDNGANIQLYKWNGTSAQVFKFNKSISNATFGTTYYRITNYNSNDEVVWKDNNVVQWSADYVWAVAEDNEGYIILVPSSKRNMCMDVAGGKVASGTNIQLYKINNTDAQRFKLIEVAMKG
ncbi:MAG: RICIN domain-containing protein [Clostridia bacterium]|nr:RICIN domain-containing protein [Clostridia bacterium]